METSKDKQPTGKKVPHQHTHENKKQQLFDSRNAYVDASLAACWDYRHQWAEAFESPWWNLPTRTHLIHKDATITTDAYLGVWQGVVRWIHALLGDVG